MKTIKKKVDALSKAMEMMTLPTNQLPQLCRDYLKHLSDQVGFSGEVCLTAYAHYCQAIENIRCSDISYRIDKAGTEWFAKNKTTV